MEYKNEDITKKLIFESLTEGWDKDYKDDKFPNI